jgi:hypothetical protein
MWPISYSTITHINDGSPVETTASLAPGSSVPKLIMRLESQASPEIAA